MKDFRIVKRLLCFAKTKTVAAGFSPRIGPDANSGLRTHPEGCGYQRYGLKSRRGWEFRTESRTRRRP